MIGFITGTVKDIVNDTLVILTPSGVGYSVHVPEDTGFLVAQEVDMYIHTAVRENDISLWGFASKDDLGLFQLLLEVSGVGLKTAYTLISKIGADRVVQAIAAGDPGGLKVPGVGGKTGQRIVLELKDRVQGTGFGGQGIGGKEEISSEQGLLIEDAVSALEGLGYKRYDIEQAMRKLNLDDYADSQELVKALLGRV